MKKIKPFTVVISTLVLTILSSLAIASDERLRSGIVQEISKDNIKLDLPTGMISYIGFTCEIEVCSSIDNISVGDEVILTLGAVNNKNKLLSIRKCHKNDKECRLANKLEIQEVKKRKEASKIFFAEYSACRETMKKDLVKDKRYISNDQFASTSNDINLKYNKLIKKPNVKICLEEFVNSHQAAIYESCIKHDCGRNIGGGCDHIVGYSITNSVLTAAVEKCSI